MVVIRFGHDYVGAALSVSVDVDADARARAPSQRCSMLARSLVCSLAQHRTQTA